MAKSQADKILDDVYAKLGLVTDREKSDRIYEIINELSRRNSAKKINGSVTGKITERLVENSLRAFAEETYFKINEKNDEWVGDFGLFGIPFNTIISVKSYSVKERGLTSGSGSALCPTILYTHLLEHNYVDFNNCNRLQSYKIRGFTSVYLPENTFARLSKPPLQFTNINGRSFLRKIEEFGSDIYSSLKKVNVNGRTRYVVDPLQL